MENPKFKTKRQLIDELGLSKSTFYRKLQKKNVQTTGELICPQTENEIRKAFGFQPLYGLDDKVGQIGTD